ncbi:cell division control protein 18 [Podospora aff. communis PSN243]|uniref:Cell division control protein n=1 Tax=Podospora aff. communis PSN243 TaxID=3040156 RepID=A0AAV9H412_9PEZI|nr:cell division control protein 18 [Podospora aff. communis PSN243]
MVSTHLGKRTRSSAVAAPESSLELPSKRPRRTARSNGASENLPKVLVDIVEDQENQQPSNESEDSEETFDFSPSKQRSRRTSIASTAHSVAPVTPSTPRHYDVFAKSVTTPRHRVMSVGKISRRMTPQTPLTPSSLQTVYHQARQLFSRSADPGQLIGRDDERAQLKKFLDRCTASRPGGCLYVSGPPGTGKSAMTNEITQEVVSATPSTKKAYVNCMSIKTSKDLYMSLFDQLVGEVDTSESDVVAILQKLFVPRKKTEDVFVVVLDEIDHILTLDLESLYRVFEWSLQKTSRLTLVGIANALDLTDRFLPRLKSRDLKPELLPFLPYTATQVKRIITTRLRSLLPESTTATPDFIPFFHPAAIELCSRKVSTQTGDLRRAFEVCRRALDLVESETRMKHENEIKEQVLQMSPSRKVLGENHNLASTARASQQSAPTLLAKALQALTVENAPRVSISHLNKVTAAAFSNGTSQRLKTLNLQQKAALCALMAMEKRNRAAVAAATAAATVPSTPSSRSQVTAPTVKVLYEAYCMLCTRDSVLHPLSASEFREVIGSLETLSLITAVDGKTGSFSVLQAPGSGRGRKKKDVFGGIGGVCGDEKRVASCVGEREMETAVDGTGTDILRSILSGEALD